MRTTRDVRVPPPPDAIDLVAGDAELTPIADWLRRHSSDRPHPELPEIQPR